jgi:hypothetical protein
VTGTGSVLSGEERAAKKEKGRKKDKKKERKRTER